MRSSVLIVDDDKLTRESLSKALSENYLTFTAKGGQESLDILSREDIDVVLSDLLMPGLSGIDILKEIGMMDKNPVVILITGNATVESAVQAMKLGAYDYITKPVNIDRLLLLIEKSLENKKLKEENVLLKNRIKEKYTHLNIAGNSPEMKKILDMIPNVSVTTATIFIEGESGTGKELISNIIHYNSPRDFMPFIKVNCAAFAEGLLESELFGHEKGAFTGAIATKKGRFELADGGTLFLDEVGDITLPAQVKLLRFLQERTFERVGGNKTFKVDVRIISATNKNLSELVKNGSLREDLYYRLRVVSIKIPPLRERQEDIDCLISHFLKYYCNMHNRQINGISEEVVQLMKAYKWPGNVRELMHCVESMVVMSKGDFIDMESIPDYLLFNCNCLQSDGYENGILANMERNAIADALRRTGGDKAKAAKILGIGLRTLYRKVDKFRL